MNRNSTAISFRRRSLAIVAASLMGLITAHNSAQGAWVVGSFNQARGGFDSLDDPGQADQKALIQFLRPDVTFSSTGTLTSAFLSGVNTMVIGGGFDASHTITPLSAAEQSALFQFVSNGGNLVVFTENSNYDLTNGAASRASLLGPFGLTTTGWIVNDTASIITPTHPIANGPGGPLTHFDLHNTGWLTSLGPYAHTIAIETVTNMPVMAAIERGAISPTSGRAVFVTDSSVFDDGFVNGPVLAANLVGYLIVPEPGLVPQAVLAFLGFATFVRVYRRNGLAAHGVNHRSSCHRGA